MCVCMSVTFMHKCLLLDNSDKKSPNTPIRNEHLQLNAVSPVFLLRVTGQNF